MKSNKGFFEDVYEVVKLIPKGRVTSYGAIANYLGTKGSARMVGWAMNAVMGDDTIPAHRVVNRIGVLSGKNHFSNGRSMEQRLQDEDIAVIDDKIQNFKEYFWDPMVELL